MKINLKKIVILALMVFLLMALITGVEATGNGKKVTELFQGSEAPEGSKAITDIIAAVLGIVRTAGAAVAIIILMTIAAKYIMASAGDRADIKKYAINYVIGAVVLLGATGILSVIKNLVDESLK